MARPYGYGAPYGMGGARIIIPVKYHLIVEVAIPITKRRSSRNIVEFFAISALFYASFSNKISKPSVVYSSP